MTTTRRYVRFRGCCWFSGRGGRRRRRRRRRRRGGGRVGEDFPHQQHSLPVGVGG